MVSVLKYPRPVASALTLLVLTATPNDVDAGQRALPEVTQMTHGAVIDGCHVHTSTLVEHQRHGLGARLYDLTILPETEQTKAANVLRIVRTLVLEPIARQMFSYTTEEPLGSADPRQLWE